MKRRHAAALAALAVVLVVWRSAARPAGSAEHAHASDPASARAARATDPRKNPRGSIRGTVTLAGNPVAGAHVCADPVAAPNLPTEAIRDALCTDSDAAGAYAIGDLFADDYLVTASARGKRPATHKGNVRVRAGATVDAIELVLHDGGGELTGIVVDIGGGPVAHAQVRASTGNGDAITETDDHGAFAIWLDPGDTRVTADADGYAQVSQSASAPGKVELRLVPESSLSGIVVSAGDQAPVAGAKVSVVGVDWTLPWADAITDEHGRWDAPRLKPGRYTISVVGPGATGALPGSVAVALGEHATDVVIEVYPAFAVEGRVVIPGGTVCADGSVNLEDRDHARRLDGHADQDGTIHIDGALPGTYHVGVTCSDHRPAESYPDVVVADRDVRGLTWAVEDGGIVHGRVTLDGKPVEGANVELSGSGLASTSTAADGTYTIGGVAEGTYRIHASTAEGLDAMPDESFDVGAHDRIERDVALENRASVRGVVVDRTGAPAAGVMIRTNWGQAARSGADGTFTFTGLRDGRVRVVALATYGNQTEDDDPRPATDPRAGEAYVEVSAGVTASVRLVVDQPPAQPITGIVVDSEGHPIADAIVDVRSYEGDQLPSVLTGADGVFRSEAVRGPRYALVARASGHGSAVEHDVRPGTRVTLTLAATAAIRGHASGATNELSINLRGGSEYRTETFFRAGGSFAIEDLTPGHYQLTFESEGGYAVREIDVEAGDNALDVELTPLVTVTGRCVAGDTGAPLAQMSAGARSETNGSPGGSDDLTDDRGRFTLHRVLAGKVEVHCNGNGDYQQLYVEKTITGGDIGDLALEHNAPPSTDEPSYEISE